MSHLLPRAAASACALIALFSFQTLARQQQQQQQSPAPNASTIAATSEAPAANLDEVSRQLRRQSEEIERLQATLREQMRLIEELRAKVGHEPRRTVATNGGAVMQGAVVFDDTLPASGARSASVVNAALSSASGASAAQDEETGERLKSLEAQAKKTGETLTRQLGSITFSGDLRLRYESIYGQLNTQPSADNPAALGNELSSRQRFRLRARLAMRGQISKEFEWGIRFATGAYPDVISTNQTLTDFFTHKNFALDQAYLTYKPSALPGLQLQGGKFEVPWLRTEMTIDNDVTVEGFNESYTRKFKKSALKDVSFVAWQLPFLERSSAFVLGADGRVNVEQSRRNGRDLALYGAQLQANFGLSEKVALTLTAADLFYSGTQFISPAQFFGPNVQIPVTVTIPATATTPAQTVTAQVSIPRDQLVAGNANLGLSTATNNAVNRDGRLSSGYNLVDLIARLDLNHSKRFPVRLLLNFVTNTQTRDVTLAGPGGTTLVLPNGESDGYWAEIQVGKTSARGNTQFGYTFIRIEKDAVLTPFNYSDFAQQSDIRAHRFNAAYAADKNVTLSLTGIVTQRANGLLGAFGTTPIGSLNRATTRLQLDTIFKF